MKSTKYIGQVCALAVFLFALAGCNSQDAKNLTQDTKTLASHATESLGNAGLAAKVNTILASWKGVDMSGLHLETKDGVVTISGHVRNEAERRRILKDVLPNIRGVDKVISKDLRVATQ